MATSMTTAGATMTATDNNKGIAALPEPRSSLSWWTRLLPHRPRRECQYCCELRLEKNFTNRSLPHSCRSHLQEICRSCIRSSVGAQLDLKPLLAIGCPSCATPWNGEYLRRILGHRDKKRFKHLDLLAKGQALVPSDLPDSSTLDDLLSRGTRFCPWCRFPFIKDGGCDYMSCTKCDKSFNISYALVLEDGEGRRAARIVDEWEELQDEVD